MALRHALSASSISYVFVSTRGIQYYYNLSVLEYYLVKLVSLGPRTTSVNSTVGSDSNLAFSSILLVK